jgi:hypothetical protein
VDPIRRFDFPVTPSCIYCESNCSNFRTLSSRARTFGDSSVSPSFVVGDFQDSCGELSEYFSGMSEIDKLPSGKEEVGMTDIGAGATVRR